MQTNPTVEQNTNIKWSESPWNQSGRPRKTSLDSFVHRTAWGDRSHSAFQVLRSLAMFHCQRLSPVSASSCWTQVWRGRPRGRFHCVRSSGVWPKRVSTDRSLGSVSLSDFRKSAERVRRSPGVAMRSELSRRSWPVRSATTVFGTIISVKIYIHCVPKKWRQNSNHYNYSISYQN